MAPRVLFIAAKGTDAPLTGMRNLWDVRGRQDFFPLGILEVLFRPC